MKMPEIFKTFRKKEKEKGSIMKVITTIPPYAPFIREIAKHPVISGVRLNTVMPTSEPLEKVLSRIKKEVGDKDLWIDLKCRQIRVSFGAFYKSPETKPTYRDTDGETAFLSTDSPKAVGELRTPPWAAIKIDRKIKIDLSKGPIKCWFKDGTESAYIVDVINGDELIMLDGPQRVVGGGEAINILDKSLEIGEADGIFTPLDLQYIEAAKKIGIHKYMISFVESTSDIDALLKLDPKADIVAKIESKKGVAWVDNEFDDVAKKYGNVRLMAARGDLYTEVSMVRPEKIIHPLKTISKHDDKAIAASRFLGSLKSNPRPSCAEITDVCFLHEVGYRTFMMGDEICFNKDCLMLALDIMQAIGNEI